MQNLLSIGGYVISLLLGIVIFLMKRELARHEDSRKSLETKISADETAQREHWEKHAERHAEDARDLADRREQFNEAIQGVHTELLRHCTESSERFLTKEEFVNSTTYLTKKTDEVSRLLQSVENILTRR